MSTAVTLGVPVAFLNVDGRGGFFDYACGFAQNDSLTQRFILFVVELVIMNC